MPCERNVLLFLHRGRRQRRQRGKAHGNSGQKNHYLQLRKFKGSFPAYQDISASDCAQLCQQRGAAYISIQNNGVDPSGIYSGKIYHKNQMFFCVKKHHVSSLRRRLLLRVRLGVLCGHGRPQVQDGARDKVRPPARRHRGGRGVNDYFPLSPKYMKSESAKKILKYFLYIYRAYGTLLCLFDNHTIRGGSSRIDSLSDHTSYAEKFILPHSENFPNFRK